MKQKLNSSNEADGLIRQATLAQNPMLYAVISV